MDDVEVKVAVAVLETKYDTISSRVGEVRDEMRTGLASVNGKLDAFTTAVNLKLDGISQQLLAQQEVSKIRARVIGFTAHGITAVVTLAAGMVLAKIFHIPVSFG